MRAPLLALAGVLAVAAPTGAQIAGLDEGWRWSEFYVQSGLPANGILDILPAHDGTVWVATTDGPAWFDGYAWHAVGPDQSLPDGRPLAIEVGRVGSEVLVVVDRRLFVGAIGRPFEEVPMVTASGDTLEVGDAVSLPDGTLLASTDRGLARAGSPATLLESENPNFRFGLTDRLYRTRAGTVFYNTGDGLRRYRAGAWEVVLPYRQQPLQVRHVRQRPGEAVWVYVAWPIGMKGMWRLGDGDPVRIPDPTLAAARAMDLDAGGSPIAVTESGRLYRVGLDGWEQLPSLPLPQQQITTLWYDVGRATWIGSEGGLHLVRHDDRRWATLDLPDRGDWSRVNAILPTPGDGQWVGTSAGLARVSAAGTVDTMPRLAGHAYGEVTGLARQPSGQVWITSGASPWLFRWTAAGGYVRFGPDDGLEGAHVHRPWVDPDGDLWLLAVNGQDEDGRPVPGGVFRATDDGRFERWPPASVFDGTRVYDMEMGPAGGRYFATNRGLVWVRGDSLRTWTRANGLREGQVFALATDSAGTLWFADRYQGVGRLAGDSITFFTTADGLPSDEVWDLSAGRAGDVWAATQGGLARWVEGDWIALGSDTGAPSGALWPLVVEGRHLYVGSLSVGARVLDLEATDSRPPRVEIDEPVVRDGSVDLSWTAYAWRGDVPPPRMAARYRVDGGPWSPWQTRSSARVALAPGTHTLEVESRGPLGAPVAGASAPVVVLPPLLLRPIVFWPLVVLTALVAALLVILARRRRRYQESLEESERRYRRFFEEDLTGDCVFDAAGTIRACNPAFARIFGFDDTDHACRHTMEDLAGYPGWWPEAWRVLVSQGRIEYGQARLRRLSGGSVACVFNMVLQRDEPGLGRAYFFDDSERMDLEEQLRQAQKMEAVGQLAGGIAHDFNNLLTAVSGYGELLLEDLPDDSVHRSDVAGIMEAARRAKDLTSKLLAFGRRQVLEFQAVYLDELVEGMLPLLRRIGAANLTIRTEHEPGVPPVAADRSSLEQVILNLVVNASDALGGKGEVVVRTRSVELDEDDAGQLDGARPGPYSVVEVEDDGPGIAPELKDRIFEPFFTTKDVGRGTGLGLSMVYGIARQSGGTVELVSSPGHGARFSVYLLPARPRDHAETLEPERDAALGGLAEAAGYRVLLVEDEEPVRVLLDRALRRHGYDVHTAGSAEDALRVVDTGVMPDVVVTDLAMPGQSGTELVDELRRRAVSCPVLVVSGHAPHDLDGETDHAPGVGFLQKPFTPSDLVAVLRDILDDEAV